MRVLADAAEVQRLEVPRKRAGARLRRLAEDMPEPELVHEVAIPGAPGFVHVQDINGDGKPEFVTIDAAGHRRRIICASCGSPPTPGTAAHVADGREARAAIRAVHGDVAFNIADIDADGCPEILVTHDFEILILNGATGEVKRRCPTPLAYKGREDRYSADGRRQLPRLQPEGPGDAPRLRPQGPLLQHVGLHR